MPVGTEKHTMPPVIVTNKNEMVERNDFVVPYQLGASHNDLTFTAVSFVQRMLDNLLTFLFVTFEKHLFLGKQLISWKLGYSDR